MYEDKDMETLKKIKESRRRKSFSSAINSNNLTDEEMDDLFLSY